MGFNSGFKGLTVHRSHQNTNGEFRLAVS